MLHPRIRNRHQLVAVFIKRIFPKPVLKRIQHAGHFLELLLRGFFLMRQDPIVDIQHAAFALVLLSKVYVVADVYVDAVVVDRVHDFPVIGFLLLGCVTLISILWYNWQEQKENEKRERDAEKLAKDAELFKLRQQLQPHFLFNSLNSINALIGARPDEARRMVQQLSDFLRGTMRKEENQLISFSEELEHLKLYLEIEKVRFGYRLKTEMDIADESLRWKIPSLLLQPIVENAIKFGLYGTTGEVTIAIRARVADKYLVIAVMNPYDADMQMPTGTGFGLNSVKRRLYLLFARSDLVEINKEKNYFVVVIKIPDTNE